MGQVLTFERRAHVAVVLVLAAEVVAVVTSVISDRALRHAGHPDLVQLSGSNWVLVVATAAAALVGAAIVRDQSRHPVGWLFLALSSIILGSGVMDTWLDWGVLVRPGSLPATGVVAAIDNSSWIFWFVIVALVLLLTPTGTYLTPRWRWVGRVCLWSGVVSFCLALLRTELDPPYDRIHNPLGVRGLDRLTVDVSFILITLVAVCLVLAAVSFILRWRRARGEERRRLLWLAIVVIPMPVFVLAAFLAASVNTDVMVVAVGGFVTLIPIAAGLSIVWYQLYDVERVLSRAATYSLLSFLLLGIYAGIVWLGARGTGRWATTPEVAATAGALTVAVIAAPLRRRIQDMLDRRFSRRRYDAIRLISSEVASGDPRLDLEELMRRAFDDPSVTVAYPAGRSGSWVSAAGAAAEERASYVDVVRRDRVVARIGFDDRCVEQDIVASGGRAAATELDNARLRAELAGRLVEVEDSRRRIADAQRQERHRIERDLHDGAQQRLLALAFELQSAQLSGDASSMRTALATGATAAQAAVRDLRSLANGLHPAALADGGLPAALDDIRAHSTVPITLDVEVERLGPATEFAAWLAMGEALVNAQKHSQARQICVMVRRVGDTLLFKVRDDGCGGANPSAPGMRGMRDRVEAAGGTLTIESEPGRGTVVAGVIPCGS